MIDQACRSDPAILDGNCTEDSPPPKPTGPPIDEPPFDGFAVTCGITFTFGGLRITKQGEVRTPTATHPGPLRRRRLVGGIFYQNYPGGAGLVSGAVLGKLRRAG